VHFAAQRHTAHIQPLWLAYRGCCRTAHIRRLWLAFRGCCRTAHIRATMALDAGPERDANQAACR